MWHVCMIVRRLHVWAVDGTLAVASACSVLLRLGTGAMGRKPLPDKTFCKVGGRGPTRRGAELKTGGCLPFVAVSAVQSGNRHKRARSLQECCRYSSG